jgi:signal transduction histidine kinase
VSVPPAPPGDPGGGPAEVRADLIDELRAAIARRVDHPTAPDDELRVALGAIVADARARGVDSAAVMRAFHDTLGSLLPGDDVRRRREEQPLRSALVSMLLRAYYALEAPTTCPLAPALAARMRDAREALAARWLERIAARVTLDPSRVFPTDELLDHVPLLVAGVADYVADPAQGLSADAAVLAHAMALGALRHAQGFDEYEIAKEFEIFGGVLFSFAARVVDELEGDCSRGELVTCMHRLYQAVTLVQQATTSRYLRELRSRLNDREARFRAFGRTLAHEVRTRVGAALGAASLLETVVLQDAERQRLAGVVLRNVGGLQETLDALLGLASVDDARQQRHVRLPEAVAEVVRQLRDVAAARGVELRVSDALPDVEVHAAIVELCLRNLVSNAIKYADPDAVARWVEIRGGITERGAEAAAPADVAPPDGPAGSAAGAEREVLVEVWDNGRGVPAEHRERVFDRYFRAHVDSAPAVEGTGLGLSLVREALETVGGRTWARFGDDLTVFAFTLPGRRRGDWVADAAGGAPGGVAAGTA